MNAPIPPQHATGAAAQTTAAPLPLLQALRLLLAQLGQRVSAEALLAGLPAEQQLTPGQVLRIAREHGFEGTWRQQAVSTLPTLLLPCLVRRQGGACAVLLRQQADSVMALLPELGEAPVQLPRAEFEAECTGEVLLLKQSAARDDRSEHSALKPGGHWFWKVIAHFRGYYAEAAVIALLVNVLALASVFFTMNVYDRVISNQAYVTLWTLAIGVLVALAFEYGLRNLRVWLLDTAGKKADLLLGSALFRQVQATRLEARPASAGAFANLLKEYESLRDFATSTVLVALSDTPFLLLFLLVLYVVAGPLFLVPLLAVPLVLVVGVLTQWPMARLMRENLRESSVRHGVLIEAIEGAETLKALRAEGWMQGKYEHSSAITALTSNKMRLMTNSVLNFNYVVSTLATVAEVVWGTYLIGEGKITQGALIAAVMLSGRALAPLTTLNGLAVRIQQARLSYKTLNDIMLRPTDREPGKTYVGTPQLRGDLALRDVSFSYSKDVPPAVRQLSMNLPRGDKLAVLGRVGSGKTSLLKVIAGLYQAQAGMVTLDAVDARQIDPADFRKAILYVGQNAQLFHGTLRDNLKMGNPFASDEDMLAAAQAMGVHAIAETHPLGYDMLVGERGENLSGGQRQCVALARAMLVRPQVLLLDEPTSAMDTATETQALQALFAFAQPLTVVLVTHKLQLLEYTPRVMVMDQGVRLIDGPREQVLQAVQEGRVRKVDPFAPAAAAVGTAVATVPAMKQGGSNT